jgi:hypothetical protein
MTPLIFLMLYFVFWMIYYYIESKHDASVILWKNSTTDKNLTKEQRELSDKYRKDWHEYDAYEKALVHIVVTLPVLFIGGSIWLVLSLILLSLGIRLILHDLLINKFLGIDINHIGTTNGFDIFLRSLEEKGISQWTVKIVIINVAILLSIIFLFI